MLLFPFCSALLLARAWSWNVLPAAAATVGAFLLREPLLTLARQRWVWKEPRPESAAARRSLLLYGALSLLGGAWLAAVLDPVWLLALGAGALALTGAAVFGALGNRQRSVWLQLAASAGLSGAALLAWLAVRPELTPGAWWLWAGHAAHGAASLLAVRARLEARLASRAASPLRLAAALAQAILLVGVWSAVVTGRPAVAAPLAFSAAMHALDLARLHNQAFLRVPLRSVGRRELAISTLFSLLLLAALW